MLGYKKPSIVKVNEFIMKRHVERSRVDRVMSALLYSLDKLDWHKTSANRMPGVTVSSTRLPRHNISHDMSWECIGDETCIRTG